MKAALTSLVAALLLGAVAAGCGNKIERRSNTVSMGFDLAGSRQGQSVGFADYDGDGVADKVVGAPYAANGSGTAGAALVYKGTGSTFSQLPVAALTGQDNLGYSFVRLDDVDGDGTDDFAVGAIHGDGDQVSLSGSVTIYKGGANGAILKKLSGEWPMDKFGLSLAKGDLNGDGHADLVAGAPFNTNTPSLYQAGAVYVFFGPDFTDGSALYASAATKGLGWAVSAGDLNGDGGDDLIISATGKVLVFFGGLSFSPALGAPDVVFTSASAGFGKALGVAGDVDGIAGSELAIGAPNSVIMLAGTSSRDVGSVYILSAATGTLVNVDAQPKPSSLLARIDGESLFSRFGSSVTGIGDVDGGGKPDLSIGAPMADVGWNILSGKAYLFKGENIAAGSAWSGSSLFPGMVKNQGYGASIAFANRVLLVGAPRSNRDTGGVDMLDPATGAAIAGGSSGGTAGTGGDCH
jgi:hypothetical protein